MMNLGRPLSSSMRAQIGYVRCDCGFYRPNLLGTYECASTLGVNPIAQKGKPMTFFRRSLSRCFLGPPLPDVEVLSVLVWMASPSLKQLCMAVGFPHGPLAREEIRGSCVPALRTPTESTIYFRKHSTEARDISKWRHYPGAQFVDALRRFARSIASRSSGSRYLGSEFQIGTVAISFKSSGLITVKAR